MEALQTRHTQSCGLGTDLESCLCAFFFVEQQLWDSQSLDPVYVLNVVEALAKTNVSVYALAHAQ